MKRIAFALCSLGLGCGGSSGTPTWIGGSIPDDGGGTGPGFADDGGDDGGDEEGDEGDDGGDDAGDVEAVWAGEAVITPGQAYDGFGEFWAVLAPDEPEQTVLCAISWPVTTAAALSDCAACEFAFELQFGAPAVDAEAEPGACAQWGADPGRIEGMTQRIGYAAGQAFDDRGGAWQPAGEAEFAADSGAFYYELVAR